MSRWRREAEAMGIDPEEMSQDSGRGLTIAERVSELLYSGKTIEEVAGYDDLQMGEVIWRRRDRSGVLMTEDDEELPPWVHVDSEGQRIVPRPKSFTSMFREVKSWQGLDRQRAEEALEEYRKHNHQLEG